MAVAAQSNPFAIFIRKIGFSVGLEHTLDRIRDFARMYGSQDTFGAGDVSQLLHDQWGLKQTNEHILDVMRALDIFQVSAGNVTVLETGEALGILFRLSQGGEYFEKSLQLLFLQSLIRADGDVFLNALAAEFDGDEFRIRMTHMIEHKWSELESFFKTPQHLNSMYRSVNIEVQDTNPGSSRGGSLTARTRPDPHRLKLKPGPLQLSAARPEVRISDAYLTKALPRRRSWAASLGLCDAHGSITELGRALILAFAEAGYSGPNCLAVWPLRNELEIPMFVGLIGERRFPVLASWEFFLLVGRGLKLLRAPTRGMVSEDGHREGINKLKLVLDTYRSMNVTKSITRIELPVRVAYLCVLGLATAGGTTLNYPQLVKEEQAKPFPEIVARKSKRAELALSGSRK